MFVIESTQHESSNGCYLKFITPEFPLGLWTGLDSAKKFDTEDEANDYLTTLIIAWSADHCDKLTRLAESYSHNSYKRKRLVELNEEHVAWLKGFIVQEK